MNVEYQERIKFSGIVVLSIVMACLTVVAFAATYNVSDDSTPTEKQKSLSVTTNDVVLIKAASGAVAVVQFTNFGSNDTATTASYRWRYRPATLQFITNGKGQARESYDSKPKANGGHIVTPKANHDPMVKAGDLRIEWSSGSETEGWLYYYPSRATVQVLPSDAFNKDSTLSGVNSPLVTEEAPTARSPATPMTR